MKLRALSLLLSVACCCMLPAKLPAAVINFNDASLANVDWTDGFVTNGAGTSTSSQQATGGSGDNGPYRRTVMNIPGGFIFVNAYHYNDSFVYTPATMGAIQSISFSIDYNTFNTGAVGMGFVVAQGSNIWYGAYNVFSTNGIWVNRTSGSLTAVDFLNQGFFGGGMPDFSANGAPIFFGYNTANSSTGGGYSTTSGHDNFSLTITHDPSTALIPEPAGMLTFSAASFALLALRRRR